MRALLGLGGNLGDVEHTMDAALSALAALPKTAVLRGSRRYRTAPVGYTDQPDFLNMVAELETGLSPSALLGACLGIEAALGRVRSFPNAPRVLDIDLLMMEGVVSKTDELALPHPRMRQRAFVLVPLFDLYPDGLVYGDDLSGCLQAVGRDGVRPA